MKHLLFDLDGTLTDSGEGIIHCGQETLAHFGLEVPDYDALRPMVGPPLRDSLQRFGISEKNMEEAVDVYRVAYVDHGQYENFPYAGIDDLLNDLHQQGYRLYVATSKPEVMAKHILNHFHLDRYFDMICGSTLDGNRITKADVIRHLLKELPSGETIIMIGDTIYDIEGANELGLPSIGVAWGYGDLEEMKKAGAVAIAQTMAQLQQIIQSM